jgi:hypothetical protein
LHPLAIEDVLSHHSHLRSKADYYQNHLFLRILSHTLTKPGERQDHILDHLPRSESPEPIDEKADSDEGYSTASGLRSKLMSSGRSLRNKAVSQPSAIDLENPGVGSGLSFARFGSFAPSVGTKYNANTMRLVHELNSAERVNVTLSPICIFLLRDGVSYIFIIIILRLKMSSDRHRDLYAPKKRP